MEEFKGFLEAVQLGLGDDYAQVLWDKRIRSARVLAAAEPDDLVCHGIDKAVARAIIKQAKDVAAAGYAKATKQELIECRLPPAEQYKDPLKDCVEGNTSAFRVKLEGVSAWDMSPDGSCTLEEAIKQHRNAADNTQRIYVPFPDFVRAVDGPERTVQDRLEEVLLHQRLDRFTGNEASWKRELSLLKVTSLFTFFSPAPDEAQPALLAAAAEQQEGQQEEEQLHGTGAKPEGDSVQGPAPPASAPSCSSWSVPTRPHPGSSTRSTGGTLPDFALMRNQAVAAAASQQQQQQQLKWREAIREFLAVSEAKRVGKLFRNGEPVDLVLMHGQESSEASEAALRRSVRRMLKQLFTYMVLTGVQFGWLSCWRATWLVWRRLESPRQLMVSRAFKDNDGGGREGYNTAFAALSWLQDLAIGAQDDRHGIDLAMVRGTDEPDSDEEEEAGPKEEPRDAGAIDDENDSDYDPKGGDAKRSKTSSGRRPSGTRAPVRGLHMSIPLLPAEAVQVLGDELGEGSSCVVLRGQCHGREAALKILTCCQPLQAAKNEASIYQVLQDLQGKQVPSLLGVGRHALGPYFIGFSLVQGVPLSQLPSLSREVRTAAFHSVELIHRHGVVHGDLQLDNMLLLEQSPSKAGPMDQAVIYGGSSSSSGSQASPSPPQIQALVNSGSSNSASEASPGPPQVMVIDFGRAYAQASPEALNREEQSVKRLLGIREQA